jgi:4-hydroxy-tetrahydrodipicolinate synthase
VVVRLSSISSLIEKQLYPVNTKYYLMLAGVLQNDLSRTKKGSTINGDKSSGSGTA